VLSALVKQIPQLGPSGQVTRIFAAIRPHRAAPVVALGPAPSAGAGLSRRYGFSP
jgi:hypothetical protein